MDERRDTNPGIPLRPGAYVLNRFRLERLLGRGGMAVVWLAEDAVLEERVALKFLPEVVVRDGHALALLAGEVKQARQLSHPNILRVHDLIMEDGVAAISMNWVDGSTLSDLRAGRERGVVETEDLDRWLPQILGALDYAHREVKLVHRDLKPSNFMVDSQDRVFVTDFAIARSLADTTTRLTNQDQSGTLVYMSPQQMLGVNHPANDYYSLGATCYDLLTGMPPFWTGNIAEQIAKVCPPPVAERREEFGIEGQPIPEVWEEAIRWCLQKAIEDRPQCGDDLRGLFAGQHRASRERKPEASRPEVAVVKTREAKASLPRKPVPRKPASDPEPAPALPPVSERVSPTPPQDGRFTGEAVWLQVGLASLLILLLLWLGWFAFLRPGPVQAPVPARPEAAPLVEGVQTIVLPSQAVVDPPERREPIEVVFAKATPMVFSWISPGAFDRADPEGSGQAAQPQRVELSRGYWLGRHEVTQAQFEAVMGGNPSRFRELGGEAPVEQVDWFAAMEFCGRLTERERAAGRLPDGSYFTLPTEAQWEYACRAGSTAAFHTGPQLSSREANYNANFPYGGGPRGEFRERPLQVGSFAPNAWGLFDMHGNVREWCLDWYVAYPEEETVDPRGPLSGSRRVVRGGGWFDTARFCRSGQRLHQEPYFRSDFLGFRVALVQGAEEPGGD